MIRIRQIKIPILNDNKNFLLTKCASLLKINVNSILNIIILKKSIDARDKSNIFYIYEVMLTISNEKNILKHNKNSNISFGNLEQYTFSITGTKVLKSRPIIVGSGPAGLFCAYFLAQNGYRPLIIERGEKIEKRVKKVEFFWNTGHLDINSNVQFGEGGAGTFSDGKLNTLVKDKFLRQRKILEIFVECGAPREILYINKPHIGTDILRKVIINMRNTIIKMGGEFLYNTCLTDIFIKDNKIYEIEVNNKEKIGCDILVLAIGHSARDTFHLLLNKGFSMCSKPFAVGVRIEHKRSMIDKNQYGEMAKYLPSASYKLTHNIDGRGVYTFCMCPGGFVVCSSSEKDRLVINGMSNYKRDEENSNSAIIVTVSKEDFGEGVFAGVEFQRMLEERAFLIGKGRIPVQMYGDFKNNRVSSSLKYEPVIKGEYSLSNLRDIFPPSIISALISAIEAFDKKIPGFARGDALLSAVESRTSSPIKIERTSLGESNILGVYPTGEGAGYAGGIMSSAVDGIYQAENIAKIYSGFYE